MMKDVAKRNNYKIYSRNGESWNLIRGASLNLPVATYSFFLVHRILALKELLILSILKEHDEAESRLYIFN